MSGKKVVPGPDEEILERIRERREAAVDYWGPMREKQAEDVAFCDRDNQWPAMERAKRERANRPCLTVDITNAFVNQLVNDERQNRPAVQVSPVHDGTDQDTAEVMQGYFRHIEMASNADYAYDRASEAQKRGGFGFIRVMTDYVSEDSFNQEPKICSIINPFQWFIDPLSTEPDGSDARFALGEVEIPKEEFDRLYPDASLTKDSFLVSAIKYVSNWFNRNKNTVRIAEYYELDKKYITMVMLPDGSTVDKATLSEEDLAVLGQLPERKTTKTSCMWYKTNGVDILDRRRIPGKLIPIIPVYGQELVLDDGTRDYSGLVRAMRDPAIMLNAYESNIAEALGLNTKSPWIVAMGSIPDGAKSKWDTANVHNYSTLEYKHLDENNNPFPAPFRNNVEPAIQAMTMAKEGAKQNVKVVTGLYDPSRGESDSGSQSGRAIEKLQRQGQTGNFHFTDNFNRSLAQVFRVVKGMIPETVDVEQFLHIVGIDGSEKMVKVNSKEPVDGLKPGVKAIFDMKAADGYEIHISAGPSYATKRQENLTTMLELGRIDPKFLQLADDILVSQMDFPAAKEIAERLVLPQYKKQEEGAPVIPPEIQAKLQQYEQMIDAQTAALEKFNNERDTEIVKLNAQKEIELIKQRTEYVKLYVTQQGKAAEVLLAAEMGKIEQDLAITPDIPLAGSGEAPAQEPNQAAGPMAGGAVPQPQPNAGPMAGEGEMQ